MHVRADPVLTGVPSCPLVCQTPAGDGPGCKKLKAQVSAKAA